MKTKIVFTIMILAIAIMAPSPVFAQDESATDSKDTTEMSEVKEAAVKTAALSNLGAGDAAGAGSVGSSSNLSPLLGESFQTDLATGSATVSLPIVTPPGRKNMQPVLALSYSSNNPNGVSGVGWEITSSSIQRSTKKGVPKYDNTDTFVFTSSGSSGELVLINANTGEYRQKIETGFMKYVYDGVNSKWTVFDKTGTRYTFGGSIDSRIVNSDQTKIFAWFLDRVEDVYGNAVIFIYEKDGGQIYLSKVNYTSNTLVTPALTADKSVLLVYEATRPDAVHNYRSGWDMQTAKRLKEIQVKADNVLVWKYALGYEQSIDTKRSLLTEITLFDAGGKSLPPKRFKYQTIE